MHWLIVLFLSGITWGLGAIAWAFYQASFVKKLDPGSNATKMLLACGAVVLLQIGIQVVLIGAAASGTGAVMSLVAMLGNVAVLALWLMAIFGMRSSLQQHYNESEPIGLKLSGVMTFFFSIFYFQYHFSRIAAWKQGKTS